MIPRTVIAEVLSVEVVASVVASVVVWVVASVVVLVVTLVVASLPLISISGITTTEQYQWQYQH